MSFGFALPLGLLALLGLALPLLVHLARREQQQPTVFAALRWLRAVQRPRQKLRLEDWLLLALRMLLVAGLALLLAAPWFQPGAGGPARVLVHPTLAPPVAGDDQELRWLAPGFPPIDSLPPREPPAVSSLLRQADAELPAGRALVVHVPALLDGADGERPRLSRPVQWQVQETAAPAAPGEETGSAPVMVIRHDAGSEGPSRWLAATQAAWHSAAGRENERVDRDVLETPWPADTTLLAWLGHGEPPASVLAFARAGGSVLLGEAASWPLPVPGSAAWRGEDGEPRLRTARLEQGRLLQFTQPLDPAVFPELLDPRFPRWLQAALQPPPPPPRRVLAAAHAPLTGASAFEPARHPLDSWLAVVLAALFVIERWLAPGQASRRPA